MNSSNEYTNEMRTSLKRFKSVRAKGFAFAIFLTLAEIALFLITAGEVLERDYLKFITIASNSIAACITNIIVIGAIGHEIEDVNGKLHKRILRQYHLNAVKGKFQQILGYILAWTNIVIGSASALDYARSIETWWMWVISIFFMAIYGIGFWVELFLLSELPKSIKNTQRDIDSLIEGDETVYYG